MSRPGTLIRGWGKAMAKSWFDWLKRDHGAATRVRGFMTRLRSDRRGNTLAIMAAALIPMAGMVGGGIDLSRMYIVKTRLQHACDAGALAGRKAMGSGTWSQSSYMPRARAEQFFDGNFQSNAYGSTGTTRSFNENAGVVSGNASATVPMTLMRVLGKTSENIAVTCQADMRLPNTDVMFVLDTTGSMAEIPAGDSVSKMDSLKTSVKCFYEIVARLDTDANCTTGTPSGGVGNQVQVRFGFMPYATNVNVGKLLPTNYFANNWLYQSREPEWTTTNGTGWQQQGNPSVSSQNISQNNVPQSSCNDASADAAGYNSNTDNYSNNGNTRTNTDVHVHVTGWNSSNGGTCYGTRTTTTTTYTKTTTQTQTFNQWHYGQINVNISGLKSGSNWNDSFQAPIGANGTSRTITWGGCIEERPTVRATNYNPIPGTAYDLDIDTKPTGPNDANYAWGPALQELIYARAVTNNWNQMNTADAYTTADYTQGVGYYCPVQATKLQVWNDPNTFDDYVDSLYPNGNTYHDIGLLWGARFMSPTGIFGTENALTPQGGEIDRHMIFMTDGDACTGVTNYQAYGVAWFDRRQTSASSAPTDGCTDTGTLTQQVNLRMAALCTAIKNKNITLWVIAFGSLASTTETRLQNCATDGRYFKATNAATLQQTFKQIADQISSLRLTS